MRTHLIHVAACAGLSAEQGPGGAPTAQCQAAHVMQVPPPAAITMAGAGSATQGAKRSRGEGVEEPRAAAAKRMALPEAAAPVARQHFWGGREGGAQREGGLGRAAPVATAAQTLPAGRSSLAATVGASSSAAPPQPTYAREAHICEAAVPQGPPEPELCRECGQVEAECERICCPWAPSTQEAGRLAAAHLESLPAEEYIAALAAASSGEAVNALMLRH